MVVMMTSRVFRDKGITDLKNLNLRNKIKISGFIKSGTMMMKKPTELSKLVKI